MKQKVCATPHYVKKTHLKMNKIDFDFFGFNVYRKVASIREPSQITFAFRGG